MIKTEINHKNIWVLFNRNYKYHSHQVFFRRKFKSQFSLSSSFLIFLSYLKFLKKSIEKNFLSLFGHHFPFKISQKNQNALWWQFSFTSLKIRLGLNITKRSESKVQLRTHEWIKGTLPTKIKHPSYTDRFKSNLKRSVSAFLILP